MFSMLQYNICSVTYIKDVQSDMWVKAWFETQLKQLYIWTDQYDMEILQW